MEDSKINQVNYEKNEEMIASIPKVNPWRRFWARLFDIALFMLITIILFTHIYPKIFNMNPLIYMALFIFVWIFIEALLLSTWGTTVGKKLFMINLSAKDNRKLKYKDALSRSFDVWLKGLWFGIVFSSDESRVKTYLEDHGETSWDEKGKNRIICDDIGFFRVIITAVLLILLFLVIFYWIFYKIT